MSGHILTTATDLNWTREPKARRTGQPNILNLRSILSAQRAARGSVEVSGEGDGGATDAAAPGAAPELAAVVESADGNEPAKAPQSTSEHVLYVEARKR